MVKVNKVFFSIQIRHPFVEKNKIKLFPSTPNVFTDLILLVSVVILTTRKLRHTEVKLLRVNNQKVGLGFKHMLSATGETKQLF